MKALLAIALSLATLPAYAQTSDEDRILFHKTIASIYTVCRLVNGGFLKSSDGKDFISSAFDGMMHHGSFKPEMRERLKSHMIEDYSCPKYLFE